MNWIKKKLIFEYTPQLKNSISHCQQPTLIRINDKIIRIFFGSRNQLNCSQIYYFDYNMNTLKVMGYGEEPVVLPGNGFDSHGVYPACILARDAYLYLYFVGFQNVGTKYTTSIGLAISDNKKTSFDKHPLNPIIFPGEYDPSLVTSPYIIIEGNVWRMWYVSGYKWNKEDDGRLQSYYHIKYAESDDGITWRREGRISIDHVHPGETNIGRPWIIKEDEIYKAWYSYACGKQGYRIGYAESTDGGYTFNRMDEKAGITVSDEPWENEAVAYPAVIVHEGRKYMFYNGNSFGKDGIALAIEEK
jgi:hypothetical protein